jgi:hypothetical protein
MRVFVRYSWTASPYGGLQECMDISPDDFNICAGGPNDSYHDSYLNALALQPVLC